MMPNIRDALLLSHADGFLDVDDCMLLYEIYIPKVLSDKFCNDTFECKNNFRFYRNDIYHLHEVMQLPLEVTCNNGVQVDGIEALCIFLMRFAYLCRFADLVPTFGRPIPQLCMITNEVINLTYQRWGHLLSTLDQPWLSPYNLQLFADAVHSQGAPLANCWGFIDGTVRPVSRPGKNQRVLYNGHKRVHAVKFQSIAAPNGLIANLYGPVEGKRHGSAMLAMSGILNQMQQYSVNLEGEILCVYGDPAYSLRPHLQAPYKGAGLTPDQLSWNKSVSSVRVAVEWVFGDIVNYSKFRDFKKILKFS